MAFQSRGLGNLLRVLQAENAREQARKERSQQQLNQSMLAFGKAGLARQEFDLRERQFEEDAAQGRERLDQSDSELGLRADELRLRREKFETAEELRKIKERNEEDRRERTTTADRNIGQALLFERKPQAAPTEGHGGIPGVPSTDNRISPDEITLPPSALMQVAPEDLANASPTIKQLFANRIQQEAAQTTSFLKEREKRIADTDKARLASEVKIADIQARAAADAAEAKTAKEKAEADQSNADRLRQELKIPRDRLGDTFSMKDVMSQPEYKARIRPPPDPGRLSDVDKFVAEGARRRAQDLEEEIEELELVLRDGKPVGREGTRAPISDRAERLRLETELGVKRAQLQKEQDTLDGILRRTGGTRESRDRLRAKGYLVD